MPNEGLINFTLRCIELREKLILIIKTNGELEYEVLVSCLFFRSVEGGLEIILVLQETRSVLRSQSVTDEPILSVTQRAGADERDMA